MKIDALVINQLTQISQRILDMIERAKDQSESLIDNLPFLFAVITGDGVILRGGDRLSKMYQCQMDDLLGKNISDLFRKPSWKIMQEKIKSARNTDMVVFETSLDYFRPTSPIIQWTIVYDNKLNFYNNSDVYYICGVDVTTTRNYEQQITKIFAGIPLGIFRVNSDLVIEAPISHYTEVLFGRDDMIGKSFHDVVYGAPGVELTAEDSKKVNNINGIIGFDEFVFDCAKDSLINKLKMIINGNERFIGISYEPIVENSEVVSLLVIVDDQTNIEIKKSEYENQKKYEEKIARNIIDIKRIPESLCPFIFKEIEKAILDLEENGFRTLKKDMIFTELHTVKRVIKKSGMSGMMLEIHRYEDMFEKAHSTEEYGSILSDCVDFMRDETDELKKLFSVFRGGTSGSQKDVNPGSIRLDDKLRKILSATAKDLEKKVTLDCQLPLDIQSYRFISVLSECLIHLVSNAIIHGIETPEKRRQNGKQESGNIHIWTKISDTGEIEIYVSDDGQGLILENLRQAASRQNLVPRKKLKSMTEESLYDLIFFPGFSVSDHIQMFSGKGHGLSNVRKSLDEIGANIMVKTEEGKGCEFVICFKAE